MFYAWQKEKSKYKLPENEEASFDLHWNWEFSEIMVRKRKLQINIRSRAEDALIDAIVNHDSISKLIKPQISIIHNGDDILPDLDELFHKSWYENQDVSIALSVISDGKRAYIRRV